MKGFIKLLTLRSVSATSCETRRALILLFMIIHIGFSPVSLGCFSCPPSRTLFREFKAERRGPNFQPVAAVFLSQSLQLLPFTRSSSGKKSFFGLNSPPLFLSIDFSAWDQRSFFRVFQTKTLEYFLYDCAAFLHRVEFSMLRLDQRTTEDLL